MGYKTIFGKVFSATLIFNVGNINLVHFLILMKELRFKDLPKGLTIGWISIENRCWEFRNAACWNTSFIVNYTKSLLVVTGSESLCKTHWKILHKTCFFPGCVYTLGNISRNACYCSIRDQQKGMSRQSASHFYFVFLPLQRNHTY